MQPPPTGTLERSAWDYLTTTSLADKLCGPARCARMEPRPPARRLEAPGRPAILRSAARGLRSRKATAGALRSPTRRAELAHTFWHHELQAAELMCWAALAFVDTPPAFRRGLMAVARDEARHMRLYRGYLRSLGHDLGDFAVRDWFWLRVPACETAAQFVAVMGVGFEGANLDHTARFAARLLSAGDEAGARLQERIGAEEEAHVSFAWRWLLRLGRDGTFSAWAASLPRPLSPTTMRGVPVEVAARRRAGLSAAFVEELQRWQPKPR